MPKFSRASKRKLEECDNRLQTVMNEAIKYYDFSVICGHRGKADQNIANTRGFSTKKWPNSRHNKFPSKAVDVAPYPINWENINRFYELAGVIKTTAKQLKIKIQWGGDWKAFKDYPHWQV
jgi:hypothetical protein